MNYSELTKRHELLIKYEGNPILKPSDWPYKVNAVFNPGATHFQKRTLLMVRVEGMDGFAPLTAARSENGRSDWIIDPIPTLFADPAQHPEEAWGIEDPRITYLQELDMYGMVYTAFSKRGPVISMALTRDFSHFERKGVVMLSEDKDAALFPRRIGGRWVLVHRPVESVTVGGAHIWLSFSPDLKYWGDSIMVLETREGGSWDSYKIGLGPQPIETSEGWLILYHGVRKTASGSLYRVGYALMDLEDPSKLIYRGNEWI